MRSGQDVLKDDTNADHDLAAMTCDCTGLTLTQGHDAGFTAWRVTMRRGQSPRRFKDAVHAAEKNFQFVNETR